MSRHYSIPSGNRSPLLCRVFAFLALSLCWLSLAHAGAVWFSDAQGLHRIDTDTNTVVQNVPQQSIVALTLNQKDNTLWALTPDQLIKVDANGATLLRIDLKSLATNFNAARKLALDPSDDSVWIAGGNHIFHLDANGITLAGFASPAIVQDIALAQDQTLWVLGRNQLLHYSTQGGLLVSANLAGEMQQTNFLAIDDVNNVLWLGGGRKLVQIALALPVQTRLSLTTSEVISALTLVADSGTLWAVGQSALFGFSKNGAVVGQTSFAAKSIGNPQVIVADALSQSLWLGHEKGISRFDTTGQYIVSLPASVKVGAISTAPSGIVPLLTLIAPADNARLTDPRTPISLHYDASCFGQPCNYPPSVFATYTLTATLNGQSIGNAFQFDAGSVNAIYTPPVRYAEGVNNFTAYVTDSAGRRSKTLTSQFTVDATPPNFLNVSPANGAVFLTPNITLQGSIDDPLGRVFLDNYSGATVSGPNPAGQNFSYSITLRPGINLFRLTATDAAGNTNSLPINFVYSTLTLSITSPVNGATVDTNKVTVTGTFSGASNPAITVNGVTAIISGSSFSAADIALRAGSNTITVIGTTPQGAQASQMLTVISSAPGITISSPANGATINSDSVLVSGQVQAPANSGVTVNGVIAIVDANNNFFANNVPLQLGSNNVTATVTTPSGKTSASSVTVTSNGPSPMQITADPIQGIAPLTIAFKIDNRTGNAVASYQFNPGGPGNAVASTDPDVLFSFTYTQPGTYQAVVTVTDSTGMTNTQALVIQLKDAMQMDQMFKAIWSGMNDALMAGDKAKALTYMNVGAKAKYGPVFDALLPFMPEIVGSYSSLQRASISSAIGEYAIRRASNGVQKIYLIYFLQGGDGVWQIDEM